MIVGFNHWNSDSQRGWVLDFNRHWDRSLRLIFWLLFSVLVDKCLTVSSHQDHNQGRAFVILQA